MTIHLRCTLVNFGRLPALKLASELKPQVEGSQIFGTRVLWERKISAQRTKVCIHEQYLAVLFGEQLSPIYWGRACHQSFS